nr:MAG TPA: hypothetical protein [Caudoviricetes sp.]
MIFLYCLLIKVISKNFYRNHMEYVGIIPTYSSLFNSI